jgi:pyroglutamyl-peptidase
MKRLLLTAFEPFGKFRVNSSWEAIRVLDGLAFGEWRVSVRRLPVSFRRAGPALERALRELRPRAAISFGLAPALSIRLERIALNVDYTERADNDGRRMDDRPIIPDGRIALESTLPLRSILRRLRRKGIKAGLSFHAGTYLCNHVFYVLRSKAPSIPAGFVHVPPLPQGKIKGWPLSRLRRAAREIVAEVARAS